MDRTSRRYAGYSNLEHVLISRVVWSYVAWVLVPVVCMCPTDTDGIWMRVVADEQVIDSDGGHDDQEVSK